MEALIVISVISIVVFLAVRANRKDKKDREIPVVVPPIPDPEIPPVVVEPPAPEPTEPEVVKNIIAEFEPYTGTPVKIPATDDNSFVDEEGKIVPFTIRIPLLINEDDTGIILSKSERSVGAEWMLRVNKDVLEFNMSRSSDVHDKIRIDIPLRKLPKELFDLVILIDLTKDKIVREFYVNARRVGFDVTASSFTGFEKTNAPINLGSNGWNDNKFTGQTGRVTIEKGRTWKIDEIIEAYQNLFNIKDLFIEPSDDGKVHIPVIPNTGQEVGLELAEAFRKVANGSDVVLAKGDYLVDLDLNSPDKQAAVELYGKHDISIDFQGARLYTSRLGIDDSGERRTSRRLQVNIMGCEDISVKNLNIESVYNVADKYIYEIEQEHGVSNTNSKNLYYENIFVKNVGGDGMYFKYCQNVHIKNIKTDGTNRMGVGVSHGSHNLKIENYEAYNCIRASIDLEGDGTYGIIDGVEITGCYLTTYLAAAGNSRINNVNIHHNRWIKDIIMKGNMWTDNPDYNSDLEESSENPKTLRLEPRENWVVEDNERIGGGGTPMAIIRIRACRNVKINRNKNIQVPTSQGRWGIDLNYCEGRIEIMNNGYEWSCINRILNCKAGTEVIIDEPNNDNIYIIEIDGVKEVRGTNPELLALIEKKGY